MSALKTLGGVFLALVVLVALLSNDDNDEDEAEPSAAVADAAKPEAPARIRLVPAKSFCQTDPAMAKILFVLTLRNAGTGHGSVDAVPWRRYSDNSVNDSILDTLTMDVPAGETKRFWADFGYDAEEHELIECGVRFVGNQDVTPLTVLPPDY